MYTLLRAPIPVLVAASLIASLTPSVVSAQNDLLAHYALDGNGADRLGNSPPMELENTTFLDNTLCLNGIYQFDPGGYRAVARINGFSYNAFTVALDFSPLSLTEPEGDRRNILTGGTSYRWLGLHIADGRLALTLNNGASTHVFQKTQLAVDRWQRVICAVDLNARKIITFLDGVKLEEIPLDPQFQFNVVGTAAEESDKSFSFNNYSNSQSFHGYADNLMVYGRALSEAEIRALFGVPDLISTYTSSPPVLDGKISFGEWPAAPRLDFGHGQITVVNDSQRLYVLINVPDDSSDDQGDFFYLTFDVDGDRAITPDVDLNYTTSPQNGNMRFQYYRGPGTWTGLQPITRSAKAEGFGCFLADGSARFTSRFGFSCNRHRVWELGIDLAEIGVSPGGTTRMGFQVTSRNPAFTDRVPENFTSSFADLLEVSVARSPFFTILPSLLAVERFEDQAIEVTQAIQDRNNTLPLVADKDTVARLYVDINNVPTSQGVSVFLYGSQGGVDLPGSPLAKSHAAPTSIQREDLRDTANFLLPASWDNAGTVALQGLIRDFFGNEVTSGVQNVTFSNRDQPTYWIVPINTGSTGSPNLVSNAEITSQQSYTETIFPVPGINWVRKPWQDIGPTSVSNIIDDLNDYAGTALLAWIFGLIFTGDEPFTFPDQIYGFAPSGGGISDPIWCGTNALVARGFRGSSREGTMAHEINHNLDRDPTGTWGRHTPFGCGATGPDSAWPYGNDDIQQVGFDTRLPWVNGTGGQDTVIPSNFPDFMSYCQSDDLVGNPSNQLPTKWISPYRWNALFGGPFNKSNRKGLPREIEDVYYITGKVQAEGTGSLKPILAQPGIRTEQRPGEYSIQIVDAGGKELSNTPFSVFFVNVEGEKVDEFCFNLRVPQEGNAAEIRLRRGGEVLASIKVSTNAPEVRVASPNGGERWAGRETIRWEADDRDGDPLEFTIFFSPDDGKTWTPVACRLRGREYPLDTSMLRGTEGGLIRILASDGVNTSEDVSDEPFAVRPNPPTVQILAPLHNSRIGSDTLIEFRGEAVDPEDGPLPDESMRWSYDGRVFGFGRSVSAILPAGVHDVTLEVFDRDENVVQETVSVFAIPLSTEGIEILSLRHTGAGEFLIRMSGRDGAEIEIEASGDLVKWQPIGRLTLVNGVGVFSDPTAGEAEKRFYRAVELPDPR